jgi:hypothetical protein
MGEADEGFARQRETQRLAGLSPEAYTRALERELFETLRGRAELRERNRVLQAEVHRLEAAAVAQTREHRAFAARTQRQLNHAACTQAACTVDGQQLLRAAQRELEFAQRRCLRLEQLCRLLLATLERAAESEPRAAAPAGCGPSATNGVHEEERP